MCQFLFVCCYVQPINKKVLQIGVITPARTWHSINGFKNIASSLYAFSADGFNCLNRVVSIIAVNVITDHYF